MREIKYRAWEKNLKEIIPVYNIDFEKRMINTESAWRLFDEIELMQYTGLHDKHGMETYFDDLVNVLFGGNYYKTVVVKDIHDVAGLIQLINDHGASLEIIGNIYENPDLIKL